MINRLHKIANLKGLGPGLILEKLRDSIAVLIIQDHKKGSKPALEPSTEHAIDRDEVVVGEVDWQRPDGVHVEHRTNTGIAGAAGRNDDDLRPGLEAADLEG